MQPINEISKLVIGEAINIHRNLGRACLNPSARPSLRRLFAKKYPFACVMLDA